MEVMQWGQVLHLTDFSLLSNIFNSFQEHKHSHHFFKHTESPLLFPFELLWEWEGLGLCGLPRDRPHCTTLAWHFLRSFSLTSFSCRRSHRCQAVTWDICRSVSLPVSLVTPYRNTELWFRMTLTIPCLVACPLLWWIEHPHSLCSDLC